jgi:hypothetical protein
VKASLRSSGYVDIKGLDGNRLVQGVHAKYCQIVQRFDGYSYFMMKRKESAIPPHA